VLCWRHVIANMPQMIIKFVLAWPLLSSRKHNSFCRKQSHEQNKLEKGNKNGIRHVWVLACPHGSSRPYWRFNLLQASHFVLREFGIQVYHCFLLWKATIIGTSKLCAKFTSLGYNSNCCGYWIMWSNNVCWTKV
jgi:hypothetical protein